MVDVFKFNKDMEGNTYYLKPVPIRWNGKMSYASPFCFPISYPSNGVGFQGIPLYRYINYCIINGELKINVYGNAVLKIMDLKELIPINNHKVAKVNVKVKQGFLDLSDSKIVDLDDCDIDYKDKFIIKDAWEYGDLVKDISEEQLYQVVSEECHLVLSYSKEQKVINGIKDLLSSMNIRMRTMKIKKLKECIH